MTPARQRAIGSLPDGICTLKQHCALRNHVTEQEAPTLEEMERFAWLLRASRRSELRLLSVDTQGFRGEHQWQYNDRYEKRHGRRHCRAQRFWR